MTNEELLESLGYDDQTELLLHLLETVGLLVLCIHWLRGTFNWQVHTGAIRYPSEQDKNNWERLFGNIQANEAFIWEIAPPRAMLFVLREFRRSGRVPEGFETLLAQDSHGRIPYDISDEEHADIKEMIRLLGDLRKEKNLDDIEDLARRLGDVDVYKDKKSRN